MQPRQPPRDPQAGKNRSPSARLASRSRAGLFWSRCAQADFDASKLEENLLALAGTIEKNRPTGCKGKLWNTATISSTMGPGIKLDLALLKDGFSK